VGCGDSDDASSPEDDAQAVATEWNEAVVEGDGETACALLTEKSVKEIEQPYRAPPLKDPRSLPGPHKYDLSHPRRPCERTVSRQENGWEIYEATVSGGRAIVTFTSEDDGGNLSEGELPLRMERGAWRVDINAFVRQLDFSSIN
jgi:hypothetical protein